MHYTIIVFPGSTCEKDCYDAIAVYQNNKCQFVWHSETTLPKTDCVIIPGGFSYGDYLRAGALAKTSAIIEDVKKFASGGGLVLGICNGFQILTEIGLLPGALIKNKSLKFICKNVNLKVVNNNTPFTNNFKLDEIIEFPIAHMEGNYFIDENGYQKLLEGNQIIFKYCNNAGVDNEESNPNGSLKNIAGICNDKKNILGLMPHPERNIDPMIGSTEGLKLFKSIENCFNSVGNIVK